MRVKLNKIFTLLYNFEEDEEKLYQEVTNYVGEENIRILDHGVLGDGSTTKDMKSIWVSDEYYVIAYTATHFAYFKETEFSFDEMNYTTLKDANSWFTSHKEKAKFQINEEQKNGTYYYILRK